MTTNPTVFFFRPFTAGALLGVLGAIVFPVAVSALWQSPGVIAFGISGVATLLSLAAMGISLVYCWRAMTFEEEHEQIRMLLNQIDSEK